MSNYKNYEVGCIAAIKLSLRRTLVRFVCLSTVDGFSKRTSE